MDELIVFPGAVGRINAHIPEWKGEVVVSNQKDVPARISMIAANACLDGSVKEILEQGLDPHGRVVRYPGKLDVKVCISADAPGTCVKEG